MSDRLDKAFDRLSESLRGYSRIAIIDGVHYWEPLSGDVPVEEWVPLTDAEVEKATSAGSYLSEPLTIPRAIPEKPAVSDLDMPLNEAGQRAIDRGVRNIRERLCQDLCDATRERISDAALAILAGNPRNRDSALARELRECRAALRGVVEFHEAIHDAESYVLGLPCVLAPARACLPGEDSDER